MWGSKRDSQKHKVYSAQMVGGGWDHQYKVDTFAEVEAYTQQILASKYVKELNGGLTPHVGVYPRASLKGGAQAIGSWRIEFGPGAYFKSVALHEIAHILDPTDGHGRMWARLYLKLTRKFLGDDAWKRLKEAFKRRNVKYSAGRTLSPERRAALKQRGIELARQKYGTSTEPTQERVV